VVPDVVEDAATGLLLRASMVDGVGRIVVLTVVVVRADVVLAVVGDVVVRAVVLLVVVRSVVGRTVVRLVVLAMGLRSVVVGSVTL